MRYLARTTVLTALAVVVGLATPGPAAAYVGPGAGLAVIGAAIAVIGAIFAAVGGFVWYPVKRLWKAVSRSKSEPPHDP
jgi:type VI protein secretion system component VasK